MTSKNEVMKELYDATLMTVGAVGLSFISKKVVGRQLGTPTDFVGVAKLAVAMGVSASAIAYLKDKNYIPDNPWRSSDK